MPVVSVKRTVPAGPLGCTYGLIAALGVSTLTVAVKRTLAPWNAGLGWRSSTVVVPVFVTVCV